MTWCSPPADAAALRERAALRDRSWHAITARRLVAGRTRGADLRLRHRPRLFGERDGGHRQGDDDGGERFHFVVGAPGGLVVGVFSDGQTAKVDFILHGPSG